jgi:hypothetical protein
MKKAPEQFRLKKHALLGSDASYGNNGFFIIPHHRILNYSYNCKISDGSGWEHVSVTLDSSIRKVERCPTWEEMCYIKSIFWSDDECVIQYHPPKDDYVSMHPYCLHLWRPTEAIMPMPDPLMVGIPG